MHKNIYCLIILMLVALMGMSDVLAVSAQSTLNLQIDQVIDAGYPALEIYVSVSDERNAPVTNLAKNNFSLTEAGLPVTNFEVATAYEKPLALVLAIDISESMGFGQPVSALSASQTEAREIITKLGPNDQIALVAFDDKVKVVQELTGDKEKVLAALDTLKPGKNASLYNGIAESALLLNNFSGRRAVVLFTDSADAGYSGYSLDQALNIAVQQKVTFFPVYWNATRRQDMTKLASLTTGKDFFLGANLPSQQDFASATNEIKDSLTALREQYRIRYISTLPASGSDFDLTVKVDYQGAYSEQSRKVMARQGSVQVDIKGLSDGQLVAGVTELVPEISAPGMISRIEIYVDEQLLDTVSGAPFKYSWDTGKTSLGEHTLKVVAVDTAGNSGSVSVKVSVTAILVEITPLGEPIDAPVQLQANITSVKPVTSVEFTVGTYPPVVGILGSTADNVYPATYVFDPAGISPGKYALKVKAYAADGSFGESTDELDVALQGGGLGPGVIVIVILSLAGILIPVALRWRQNMLKTKTATATLGRSARGNALAIAREVDGLNPGQVWPLNRDEIKLGRKSDENDIPLKGVSASRHHAVIRRMGDQYILSVLNPANPVIVNGKSVSSQKELVSGDVIQAGESRFQIEQ